ncbi:MAG: acyl-CoA/acyl-ACP dehydrogenase [Chloroflexi bacterium]|nr:acyl-CoA/acyl-ACP dehydrogenase [Chloroflexota bacterium]
MDFTFSDEQNLLRETARDFLARKCPPAVAREALTTYEAVATRLWRDLADVGWTGLSIPEAQGGSGLDAVSQAIVFEELGRAVAPVPYWSTTGLAAGLLVEVGDPGGLLPAVASGQTLLTVAVSEFWRDSAPVDTTTSVRLEGDRALVSGRKTFVTDAGLAGTLLVVAARGDALALVPVDRSGPGVRFQPLSALDATRPVFAVDFDAVAVPAAHVVAIGSDADLWRGLRRGLVTLCAEMVGSARQALDLTVAYVKERRQFDRPIGSFQAIKHQTADMLVNVETARVATYYAATALDGGADDVAEAVQIAKAVASEQCWRTTAQAIQLHGGIGFTWEHDLHLYFKRTRQSASLLGDARWHYDRLADTVLV